MHGPNCTNFGEDIGQSSAPRYRDLIYILAILLHFKTRVAQRRGWARESEGGRKLRPYFALVASLVKN